MKEGSRFPQALIREISEKITNLKRSQLSKSPGRDGIAGDGGGLWGTASDQIGRAHV